MTVEELSETRPKAMSGDPELIQPFPDARLLPLREHWEQWRREGQLGRRDELVVRAGLGTVVLTGDSGASCGCAGACALDVGDADQSCCVGHCHQDPDWKECFRWLE